MNRLTRLRMARMTRGLRQATLAKRAGIDQPLLSRLESGELVPGPKLQARLASILDVPAAWLFEREP